MTNGSLVLEWPVTSYRHTHLAMLYDSIMAGLVREGDILWEYSRAWGSMSTACGQLPSIGCRSINLLSDETEDQAEKEANSCHEVDWTDGKGGKKLTLYDFKFIHPTSIWAMMHVCNFNPFLMLHSKKELFRLCHVLLIVVCQILFALCIPLKIFGKRSNSFLIQWCKFVILKPKTICHYNLIYLLYYIVFTERTEDVKSSYVLCVRHGEKMLWLKCTRPTSHPQMPQI